MQFGILILVCCPVSWIYERRFPQLNILSKQITSDFIINKTQEMMNRNNQKAKHAFNSKNVIRIFSVIRKGVRNGVCEDGHLRICANETSAGEFSGKRRICFSSKKSRQFSEVVAVG